jgi:hypothetical protein
VKVGNISNVDEIIVADMNGKVINHYFSCETPLQMAIGDLARGAYFISVKYQGMVVIKKLVIE